MKLDAEVEDILIPKDKSSTIKNDGFELQLFAAKDPRDQIAEYAIRQKINAEDEDWRIKYYTKANIDKAKYFYEKNLRNGMLAPDGSSITIKERKITRGGKLVWEKK
jgi:hypothetical protein